MRRICISGNGNLPEQALIWHVIALTKRELIATSSVFFEKLSNDFASTVKFNNGCELDKTMNITFA